MAGSAKRLGHTLRAGGSSELALRQPFRRAMRKT
jgi:hypothetical protein